MTLRIGVDLDGTLADLSSAYHDIEVSLFGRHSDDSVLEELPAEPTDKEKLKAARARSREQDAVWQCVKSTPDFWEQLKPIEPNAVRDLQAAVAAHGWEVFFITQRPKTAGASVQLQTQRWLVAQGFEWPSVLTLSGARGKAAHALDLDVLIDDLPKNCIDVISDSRCRPILVLRTPNPQTEAAALRMNIGVVTSVAEAIALLAQPVPATRETAMRRILKQLRLAR